MIFFPCHAASFKSLPQQYKHDQNVNNQKGHKEINTMAKKEPGQIFFNFHKLNIINSLPPHPFS